MINLHHVLTNSLHHIIPIDAGLPVGPRDSRCGMGGRAFTYLESDALRLRTLLFDQLYSWSWLTCVWGISELCCYRLGLLGTLLWCTELLSSYLRRYPQLWSCVFPMGRYSFDLSNLAGVLSDASPFFCLLLFFSPFSTHLNWSSKIVAHPEPGFTRGLFH